LDELEETWRGIASSLRYCHGTTDKFEREILKYGILPRKTDGVRKGVYEGHLESRLLDSVYLSTWFDSTPAFCGIAAENAAERLGGEPVVFEVKLEPGDFERFERDEDSFLDDYRHLYRDAFDFALETGKTAACMEGAVKDAVMGAIERGELTKEEARDPPKWFAELACYGRFALRGRVPPERIVAVRARVPAKGDYAYPEKKVGRG